MRWYCTRFVGRASAERRKHVISAFPSVFNSVNLGVSGVSTGRREGPGEEVAVLSF
jgi:hypothetical protein